MTHRIRKFIGFLLKGQTKLNGKEKKSRLQAFVMLQGTCVYVEGCCVEVHHIGRELFISAGRFRGGSIDELKQHFHFVHVSDNNDLCKLLSFYDLDLLPREIEFIPLCWSENVTLLSS